MPETDVGFFPELAQERARKSTRIVVDPPVAIVVVPVAYLHRSRKGCEVGIIAVLQSSAASFVKEPIGVTVGALGEHRDRCSRGYVNEQQDEWQGQPWAHDALPINLPPFVARLGLCHKKKPRLVQKR
jgi:hypothetical protein